MSDTSPSTTSPARPRNAESASIAVIDIGSNLIRMAIAELRPDGTTELLEKLQRTVWLGQDTFRQNRLSRPTIQTAIAVLRDYRRLLDFYGTVHVRAIATSAVREAMNADTFIDRVYMAADLEIEIIDTAEESRLAMAALRNTIPLNLLPMRKKVLIAEVGGGSTLLTLLQGAEIMASQSLPLGSVRLKEVMYAAGETPLRTANMLQVCIDNELKNNMSMIPPLDQVQTFIIMGGDARFLARRIGRDIKNTDGIVKIIAKDLEKFMQECQDCAPEQLATKFNLGLADAQTLLPALLVYHNLIKLAGVRDLLVSPATMRDGLLLDLTQRLTGKEDRSLDQGVIHSAQTIARKYQTDMPHAENVTALALALFDELQRLHRLQPRHRLLLHVAGLLHDIGHFLSPRAHHKHSYYLISNSEIFGLARDELLNVALISRYHRRSAPKSSHPEYTALARERRMIISKLAAILRVADALDVAHRQHVRSFRCDILDEELVLHVPNTTDLTIERRALALKSDLFTDIFGLKIRLEEYWLVNPENQRARPIQ